MTTVERLRQDISELTTHEDRRVGSAGHAAARAWAEARMQRLGLAPYSGGKYVLPYEDGFANVVGVAPGLSDSLPIVLGAHYDTVPGTPGADDNAASVAVVFEVAARLVRNPAARPVVIAIFDAEEPPYFHTRLMGSTRFVEDHIGERVHAAVILDLIAHATPLPGLEDIVALMGAESHPEWSGIARRAAELHLQLVTVPNDVLPDMSDHYAFRLAGRPYLFVTCGQGPHYHRPSDTLENLDLEKAARVTDLVEMIVREAGNERFGDALPHDSGPLDYEMLRRVLGDEALAAMGVTSPTHVRDGLGRLVRTMLG